MRKGEHGEVRREGCTNRMYRSVGCMGDIEGCEHWRKDTIEITDRNTVQKWKRYLDVGSS